MSMTPARLGASSTWAAPRPVTPNSDTRTMHRICFRSLMVRSFLAPVPRHLVVQPFLLNPEILLESRVSQMIQMPLEQILVVFHAPVLEELFVRLHADPRSRVCDWLRVDLWIIDRELICDAAGVNVAQTFDDVQRIAGRVFRSDVESDAAVKTSGVDHERVTLIPADRGSHPLRIELVRHLTAVRRNDVKDVVRLEK